MRGTRRPRAHLGRGHLLLLVLWGCTGAAAWHPPTCLPTTATAPQPVLGFWELLRRGTGCSSQERSATGRDVHAVSLRRGVPARGQVTLVLDAVPPDSAPIFVLHSPEPVSWVLPSPPGANWTFEVSPGSRVSAAGPVASSEAEIVETPRELLKWARRRHGGVTSLAEYRGVNTVYLHLGADGTAPATCRLHRHFFTSMHFASERHRQPLKVCLNPDPPRDLEVHIILSKGAAPRPSLARLTVELHAARRSRHRGLFLILKSDGPAQWMVQAQHLTGQLHILASHKVVVSGTDVDLPLTVTQHTPPGLADAKDLLQYAADQKLPAVMSYTEAERVNRFLLLVGMNAFNCPSQHDNGQECQAWQSKTSAWCQVGEGDSIYGGEKRRTPCEAAPAPPEDPPLLGPMFLPPPSLMVKTWHFPEAATVSWGMRQEDLGEEGSAVHPVPTAKIEGVESRLCLGGRKPLPEKKPPQKVSPPEATMAFQDLPFHHGNFLLSLEVYNSEAFAKQPGPCTAAANSRVFVEASLATYDPCLGFTIQQCFISPSSDPLVTSPYLLIQHGCAADTHVNLSEPEQAVQGQALPPGYQERQRLSFLLQPRSNDSIHFLHCRLTLCSREPHDPTKPKGPVPKCRDESEACKEEEEPASEHFQRIVTKPIIVTINPPVRAATPGLKRDSPLARQQGKLLKDARHSQKTQPVPTTAEPSLELPAVVGIAFSAFVIGISLTGGLWYIHSQTDFNASLELLGEAAARKRSQPAAETDHEETAVPKPLELSSAPNTAGPAHGSLP